MHWSLIVLIVVVSLIIYAIGAGVTLGVLGYINKFVAKEDSTIFGCIMLWWLILPFVGLIFLGRWVSLKVNKNIQL